MRWRTNPYVRVWWPMYLVAPLWAPVFLLALGIARAWEVKCERFGPNAEWMPWFAWHPVDISGTERSWLEWVERRALGGLNPTEYRLAEPTP